MLVEKVDGAGGADQAGRNLARAKEHTEVKFARQTIVLIKMECGGTNCDQLIFECLKIDNLCA